MRLFVHREQYGRFVSCLVFVPRDRYTHAGARAHRRRARSTRSARRATSGTRASRSRCSPGCTTCCASIPTDARATRSTSPSSETRVAAAARAWVDDLRDALVARARRGRPASTCCASGATRSPASYQEDVRRGRGARRPRRARARSTRPTRRRSRSGSAATPTTSTSSSTASARSRRSPRCCPASRTWA